LARSFDRVLLDAPCSNTGVLRRRLELRWRIQPEEITRLAETQCRLIARVAEFVRPGGILVYSTCSLESEENDGVILAFTGPGSPFELLRHRQVNPVHDGVDGAFVAVLRRRPA
jgi:16S rRNA (cytosine967-C5)-methyltransferase